MTAYLADLAWVDGAIHPHVGLEVDDEGRLAAVTPGTGTGQRIAGLVVPGLANLHSQACRRALAGLAGPAVEGRLLAALTPDDLQAVAARFYAECLLHGYCSVAAFQTVHHAPDGRPYDDPAELSLRLVAAAAQAGIGLLLLPAFRRSGEAAGQRGVLTVEAYGRLCQDLAEYAPVGVALPAPAELQAALLIADLLGAATPVHVAFTAATLPWLLANAKVDRRWCLLPAGDLDVAGNDAANWRALAATGAVAGLCPSREAAAGGGLFPLLPYVAAGGRFGIGSVGNLGASPAEELRWLDYLRRLEQRRPDPLPLAAGESAAAWLLGHAAAGGAQALGRAGGAIRPGLLADLVVLDPDHPSLAGRSGTALLDAWVFAGNMTPVRQVMVAGRWVVQHGAHVRGGEIAAAFARTMRRLADAL